MIDVSVIIVNYKTPHFVIDCISSIKNNTINVSYEIIVVDNFSNDNSENLIKYIHEDIIFISLYNNSGFSKANNLAANIANGEYLFFLNSDTVLLNNAILHFFNFYNKNLKMNIGAIGSSLLNEDFQYIHSCGNFLEIKNVIFNQIFSYFKINKKRNYVYENFINNINSEQFLQVDYITGADLFIKKETFKMINGFNEIFFMYCEDMELCKRLNSCGFSSFLINSPRIIHFEGGSNQFSLISFNKRKLHAKSMFQYFFIKNNIFIYFTFRVFYFILRLPILFDFRVSFNDRIKYLVFLISFYK